MAEIEFSGVSKEFVIQTSAPTLKGTMVDWVKRRKYQSRKFSVLSELSFTVDKGETLAILGPNGTGKSTILKLVAGIYRPDTGRISVNGRVAALLEIGAGFQPDLTGRENVYLYGSILGMSKKSVTEKYDDIIDFSGIGMFIDMPVRTYSSGMYMRLAFSVAIHVDPQILVIDEVLAVGDEQFQQKCFDKIEELKRAQTTILFVSHDTGSVRRIADKVLLLGRNGECTIGGVEEKITEYHNSGL